MRGSVEFNAVTKRYGPVVAVNAVSFSLEPGTLLTLLGPSGCGKTTTLRLIAGLEMADEGRILIGNNDVTRLSAADRSVSMVFQSYALFPHMTVLENVAYGPRAAGRRKAEAYAIAMEKIELVGLGGLEQRAPFELSGGQQQRVAVARALVLEPEVLLFDEPLSNLDAKLRRRVRDDIRELQQRLRLTVVYVTHDQEEALAVSDRIIVMSEARIAQSGTPRELYEQPASLFVADFIGDANICDAEIIEQGSDTATVRLGGISLEVRGRGLPNGHCKVAIRPNTISLRAEKPSAPALAGHIRKAVYLGKNWEVTVDCALGEILVTPPNDRGLSSGDGEVWLSIDPSGVTVIPDE